jgi:hypothetical protein
MRIDHVAAFARHCFVAGTDNTTHEPTIRYKKITPVDKSSMMEKAQNKMVTVGKDMTESIKSLDRQFAITEVLLKPPRLQLSRLLALSVYLVCYWPSLLLSDLHCQRGCSRPGHKSRGPRRRGKGRWQRPR